MEGSKIDHVVDLIRSNCFEARLAHPFSLPTPTNQKGEQEEAERETETEEERARERDALTLPGPATFGLTLGRCHPLPSPSSLLRLYVPEVPRVPQLLWLAWAGPHWTLAPGSGSRRRRQELETFSAFRVLVAVRGVCAGCRRGVNLLVCCTVLCCPLFVLDCIVAKNHPFHPVHCLRWKTTRKAPRTCHLPLPPPSIAAEQWRMEGARRCVGTSFPTPETRLAPGFSHFISTLASSWASWSSAPASPSSHRVHTSTRPHPPRFPFSSFLLRFPTLRILLNSPVFLVLFPSVFPLDLLLSYLPISFHLFPIIFSRLDTPEAFLPFYVLPFFI